ncbi:MAG: hypothetical protein J2P21_15580 [Chloracidobacterium sp.]|nr:hypothetical protein [Chloracidobacterium sp.]
MKASKSSYTIFKPRLRRRILFWAVILIPIIIGAILLDYIWTTSSRLDDERSSGQIITPIPFEEMNDEREYNASDVVPLADSRFLFCDNNSKHALFELDLGKDGRKNGPLIERPLEGLSPKGIDDMEAMTIAEEKGRRFIFVASSLSLKNSKKGKSPKVRRSGLLRVTVNPDNSLSAENMAGFRDWFVENAPAIAAAATRLPDEGGLNVEGLAWDRERHTLLFGLRSPLSDGYPLIIPVRVNDLNGPWTTDNLKMLPPIRLSLDADVGLQGIRSIEYVESFHAFLIVLGKAISGEKAPFELYEWKGERQGKLHQLDVSFAKKMKPEGLTNGTVAGRPVILFVDDRGGYQVLWLDKARL